MIFIMKPLNDFNNGEDDLQWIGGSRVNEQREIATVIQARGGGTQNQDVSNGDREVEGFKKYFEGKSNIIY